MILDIVGYTQFIQFNQTSLLHAEAIISELLETVIDKAEYPLTLNKLEGDAALLYADLTEADITAAARDILNQVDAFFNAFHARIRLMVSGAACPCDACQHIGHLKLKAILNKGEVAFKTVRQFQELTGLLVIGINLSMVKIRCPTACVEYWRCLSAYKTSGPLKEYSMRTIILISCVARSNLIIKGQRPYISPLFRKNLAYARKLKPDAIYILSAKYGLLDLDTEVEPYDLTLTDMPLTRSRLGQKKVIEQLSAVD